MRLLYVTIVACAIIHSSYNASNFLRSRRNKILAARAKLTEQKTAKDEFKFDTNIVPHFKNPKAKGIHIKVSRHFSSHASHYDRFLCKWNNDSFR